MNELPERHDLWRLRFYYLVWFGGAAFANPFMNLFYLHIGLTGTQIGWIGSIGAIVTLLAAPFWAGQGITFKYPRPMLQFFMVINAVSLFLLSQQVVFLGVAGVVIFRAFFTAGIMPISDALALSIGRVTKAGFGSVRVFGSLGWVIFVLLSGWLVERTELKVALIGAGTLTFISALLLFQIAPSNFTRDQTNAPGALPVRRILKKLLDNPLMLGLGLMIVIVGFANSGVQQFEMTYLSTLGASKSLIGIAGMLGAVVELGFMFIADYLMRKRSPYQLLMIAMLMYVAIRLTVFAFPSVPLIMAALATTGISFSFYTIAMVRFIGEETAPHETRMMLAFFTVTLTSLTAIVSAPLAGAFFDHFGARWLYLISAAGFLLAWVNLNIALRTKVVNLIRRPK